MEIPRGLSPQQRLQIAYIARPFQFEYCVDERVALLGAKDRRHEIAGLGHDLVAVAGGEFVLDSDPVGPFATEQ